jgi:hypothetical protein
MDCNMISFPFTIRAEMNGQLDCTSEDLKKTYRHSDWVYPIRWAVTICGTRGSLQLQFEIAFMESLLDSLKGDVGANWQGKKEPKRQLQQPIARTARAASMSGV